MCSISSKKHTMNRQWRYRIRPLGETAWIFLASEGSFQVYFTWKDTSEAIKDPCKIIDSPCLDHSGAKNSKSAPSENIYSFLARAAIGILFFTNLFQEQKCVMSFKHKARKGMYLNWCSPQKSALNSSRLTSSFEQHNQSHYREVPRWEIFMEQDLRFR